MKKYYLYRTDQSSRYSAGLYPMRGSEKIGPFESWDACKAEQAKRNAEIPRKKKAPGGGRPAKNHVRCNYRMDAEIHRRLVEFSNLEGITETAAVERILDRNLPK
jgi:hypothetical protein